MVISPSLKIDRVRSESLEHLTQSSWNALFHLDAQKVYSSLWLWTQGKGSRSSWCLWCGQFPQLNKFIEARDQEFASKGFGLAVADPDMSVYTGVSIQ